MVGSSPTPRVPQSSCWPAARSTPRTLQQRSREADAFAAKGLRLLALARGDVESVGARDDVERDLDYVGLVALLDPPRPEVAAAVSACHRAGIRIIVITGDHALTALEVARRVGVDVDTDDVVAAERIDEMSDAALEHCSASAVNWSSPARRRRRSSGSPTRCGHRGRPWR